MYSATTHGIRVAVEPRYLEEKSDPKEARYLWAYTIEIRNTSGQAVQLLNRRWEITDANGRTEIVRGPGVVGQQPVIEPGEAFTYTSGCPLTTASGIMVGSYEMIDADGRVLQVAVPAFPLDVPGAERVLN